MKLEYENCPVCFGKKEVLGMGLIKNKCPKCKGVGKIESTRERLSADLTDNDKTTAEKEQSKPEPKTEVKVKKKRGPKPGTKRKKSVNAV